MLPSNIFITLSVIFTGCLALVPPSPEVLALSPVGNVAAVLDDLGTGESRLYYQNSDNSITELAVGASLIHSHTTNYPGNLLVPGDQVLNNTPIAAATVGELQEIHVYFLSPYNILSEYIWDTTWQGGPNCTECLTASGLVVAEGSQILYAMYDPDTAELRVGFISAGSPRTLTEAVRTGGQWELGQL